MAKVAYNGKNRSLGALRASTDSVDGVFTPRGLYRIKMSKIRHFPKFVLSVWLVP